MYDDNNPFSATSAEPNAHRHGATGSRGDLSSKREPVPIDIGPVLQRAFDICMEHAGLILGVIAVQVGLILLQIAIEVPLEIVAELSQQEGDDQTFLILTIVGFLVRVVGNLINFGISLGTIKIFGRLAFGNDAHFGMIIPSGYQFIIGMLASFLFGIAIFFSLIMLIIPAIVVGLGLQFYLYTIVHEDIGVVDSLQRSWNITDGYKVQLLVVSILLSLLSIALFCLTLGVGYLIALPVFSLVQAVLYHSLYVQYETRDQIADLI